MTFAAPKDKDELHLWHGQRIDAACLDDRIASLDACIAQTLATPVATFELLLACERLSQDLLAEGLTRQRLLAILVQEHTLSDEAAKLALAETADFLKKDNLTAKLQRELGTSLPLVATRTSFKEPQFETWAPLGFVVHLAAANAPTAGALSVVEGLMTGNINALKISSKDGSFALALLEELGWRDDSGKVARHIIVLRLGSQDPRLASILAQADGVAAWGGEKALRGARALTPDGARFIDWGPKISLTYATLRAAQNPGFFERLAAEIVAVEQQACASPQLAYFDTEDPEELRACAQKLALALAERSGSKPTPQLDLAARSEITNVVTLTRLESHLGLTEVIAADDASWHVLIDHRRALRASPLHRTIWVKALPRREIIACLRPMRRYLQTLGLEADLADMAPLSALFVSAGILRITPVGGMLASYPGEPHDGVYALSRYARRISIQANGSALDTIASFDQLAAPKPPLPSQKPILSKEAFQARIVPADASELYFRSGGSSGQPKLSVFTYDDYHEQMRLAAHGLLAAGLEPARDVSINLFFGGHLYGGFISFFSVFEALKARHLPMSAIDDREEVCRTIIDQKVNVLFGMPSYLLSLFDQFGSKLAAYGGIEKIFYGGEHFTASQRRRLTDEFGIKHIKSASYGSVDAGPLGYQCRHSDGAIHHLHVASQSLEILALDRDEPAQPGEAGRLIFSSHMRRGQDLSRYDIGDLGRWIPGTCACGITAPRFELLGRHGDVFRIGSEFLNYRNFVRILDEELGYAGEAQLILDGDAHREYLELRLGAPAPDAALVRKTILDHIADLAAIVHIHKILRFEVAIVAAEDLLRTAGSGKLRSVIDQRQL